MFLLEVSLSPTEQFLRSIDKIISLLNEAVFLKESTKKRTDIVAGSVVPVLLEALR